jgi:HD-like signal output (HDOD) protein
MPPAAHPNSAREIAAPRDSAYEFVAQLADDLSRDNLDLPSFPEAVLRIQQVVSNPSATVAAVARAVQAEPVFTARLFRMANSVILRRGEEPVTNVATAINRLGFTLIKNLAVAVATRQVINSRKCPAHATELGELWRHSVDTAAIAYVLANATGAVAPHDALLAGLVHDIGIAYIYTRLEAAPDLANDTEAVRWILADWHPTIGRAILEKWEFPSAVIQATEEHETLDRVAGPRADLTDVLIVANALERVQTGTAASAEARLPAALARLAMNRAQADALLAASREEAELIRSALS